MSKKIGFLLPQSNLFSVSQDFIGGFKLGIKNIEDIKLFVESTGFNKKDVLASKINKLKLQDDVDFITGISHWRPFIEQAQIFDQNRVPVLLNDIGANLPLPQPLSKYVYFNSFNLWQSMFALGKHIAKNVGKKVLLLSHFYDGGYHTPYSLAKGMMAEGGTFLAPFMVQEEYDANHFSLLKNKIETEKPDAIVCLYANPRHHILLDWLKSAEAGIDLPIFSTPNWIDDYFLNQKPVDSAIGVQSCTTWNRSLENPVNQTLVESFEDDDDIITSPFAMLGYESGCIVSQAIETLGEKWSKQKYFQEFIHQLKLKGPRNGYYFHEQLQCSFSESYLNEVVTKEDGQQNLISKKLDTEGSYEIFAELYSALNTGWDNTYLCV